MTVALGEKAFTQDIVVFVEGRDEEQIFRALLANEGWHDVDVRGVGGKYRFSAQFELAIKQASFISVRSFGIVQDADDDPAGRLASINAVLTKNGFSVPGKSGEFVQSGQRKVGALIVPSGDRAGSIETLFLDAHASDQRLACVKAFDTCCRPDASSGGFTEKQLAYSLLCALNTPQPRLGLAFMAGDVNPTHNAYDPIRSFLGTLRA